MALYESSLMWTKIKCTEFSRGEHSTNDYILPPENSRSCKGCFCIGMEMLLCFSLSTAIWWFFDSLGCEIGKPAALFSTSFDMIDFDLIFPAEGCFLLLIEFPSKSLSFFFFIVSWFLNYFPYVVNPRTWS